MLIRILEIIYMYNEPLMIIIVLILAISGKTNDDMDLAEYVVDAEECD